MQNRTLLIGGGGAGRLGSSRRLDFLLVARKAAESGDCPPLCPGDESGTASALSVGSGGQSKGEGIVAPQDGP